MVMLLTVSLTPRLEDNNEIKIKKRIPLLISRLQHWVVRVNGLPFSQKTKKKTILALLVTTLGKFG